MGIDDDSYKIKEHSKYSGIDSHFIMTIATTALTYNHHLVL